MTVNNPLPENLNISDAIVAPEVLSPISTLDFSQNKELTPTTTPKTSSNPLTGMEQETRITKESTEKLDLKRLKMLRDELIASFEEHDFALLRALETNKGLDKLQKLIELDAHIWQREYGGTNKGGNQVNILNIDASGLRGAVEDFKRLERFVAIDVRQHRSEILDTSADS